MSYPFIVSAMETNQKKEIARLVKEGRVSKGLTQQELSERVGLSLRSIQRIENADVLPRLYTLRLLSQQLDISLQDYQERALIDSELPIDPSNRTGWRRLNQVQKLILSVGVGLVFALLSAAYLAQSSRFPETGFEFLLLVVGVLSVYIVALVLIWK